MILQRLLRRAARLTAADGAAVVSMHQPPPQTVVEGVGCLAWREPPPSWSDDGLLSRCAAERTRVRATGSERARFSAWLEAGGPPGTLLADPLVGDDGEVLGVLLLAALAGDALPDAALSALPVLGGAIADALVPAAAAGRGLLDAAAGAADGERWFRAFMSALPAGAWIKDGQGRFSFVNERFEQDWGVAAAALLGRTRRAIAGDDPVIDEAEARVRRAGEVVRTEQRLTLVDGNVRTFWCTRFPILAHGGEVHVGGIAIDISERKASEAMLRESEINLRRSESNLRAIVENLAEGMFIQRDGVVLYANRAALGVFGARAPEELLQRNVRDLVAREEWPALQRDIDLLDALHSRLRIRKARRLDGTRIDVEAHASRIHYEGAPALAVLVRDVTEQRAVAERLQIAERLAAVGTLAAAVAHEINNPLTLVTTNLGLLLEDLRRLGGGLPAEERREMEAMGEDALGGAERIRRIVRAMRALSRDPRSDEGEVVELGGALDAAVELSIGKIRPRAQLVREPGPVPAVVAHHARLVQVFVNLLSNAGLAIPLGDPSRHQVRVRTATAPAGEAVVEIVDTGCGISAEALPHIFDPFFTTRSPGEGIGLGLSVAHNVVTAMGGRIEVETEPGRGTTVRLLLPPARLADQVPAPAPDSASAAPATGPARRARILVVDDEESIARAIGRLLHKSYEVVLAGGGAEALQAIEAQPIDAVISDLMMPEMDGRALFAEIERRSPQLARRVIFITGGAFVPAVREFLERVPNQRLEKPIDFRQLRAAVETLLAPGLEAPTG